MPHRMKCCNPSCGCSGCIATEKSTWFVSCTGTEYTPISMCSKDAGLRNTGECQDDITFNFVINWEYSPDTPNECYSEGLQGYINLTSADGGNGVKDWYGRGWTDSNIGTCDNFSVDGCGSYDDHADSLWTCYCWNKGCDDGSGEIERECDECENYFEPMSVCTFQYNVPTVAGGFVIDANWYDSGVEIGGDISLFNPNNATALCDNYLTMLRKITLTPRGGACGSGCFRIKWTFAGNPETGTSDETCYYHDYALGNFSTNEFQDVEDCINEQEKYGLYATGGSTNIYSDVRFEDGVSNIEYNITNDTVKLYYKKPNGCKYKVSVFHKDGCCSLCSDATTCESDNVCAGTLGFWYSEDLFCATSDGCESFDNCPSSLDWYHVQNVGECSATCTVECV